MNIGATHMSENEQLPIRFSDDHLKELDAIEREFKDALAREKQEKDHRNGSFWSRVVDVFTTTDVEREVMYLREKKAALYAKMRSRALGVVHREAYRDLKSNPEAFSMRSSLLDRQKQLTERHAKILELKRLADDAAKALDCARRSCSSASTTEFFDMLSKNKAISVISSIETSDARSDVQKASKALKALSDRLPKKGESFAPEDFDDFWDLVVDFTLAPGFDFLSFFNMDALDKAEKQCKDALQRIDPLVQRMAQLVNRSSKDLLDNRIAVQSLEAPFLKRACESLPKAVTISVPEKIDEDFV